MSINVVIKTLAVLITLSWHATASAAQTLGKLEGAFLNGVTSREPFKFDTGIWKSCSNVFFGANMVSFCAVEGASLAVQNQISATSFNAGIDSVKISVRSWQNRVIREYTFSGWWSESTATDHTMTSMLTIVLWRFTDAPANTYQGYFSLDDFDMTQELKAWKSSDQEGS